MPGIAFDRRKPHSNDIAKDQKTLYTLWQIHKSWTIRKKSGPLNGYRKICLHK